MQDAAHRAPSCGFATQDNPTGLSGLPKIITHPRSVKRKTVARNPRSVKRTQPLWEGKKFGAARAKPRGRLFLGE